MAGTHALPSVPGVRAARDPIRGSRLPLRRLLRGALAVAAAALILQGDIATGARGLAGVLYVPVLSAIAVRGRRGEVAAFGALCTAFAIAAWWIASRRETDHGAPWPLIVVLLTRVTSTVFLTRFVASREALQVAHRDLSYSEWRYRSIFEQSRFPFWEQDFSRTLALYDRLRSQGVTSLLDHYREDPDLPRKIAESIINLDVNDAMVALVGAKSREDFPKDLTGMGTDPITLLRTQQGLFDGAVHHDGQSTITTRAGEMKDIWVTGDMGPERPGIMVGFLVDLTETERAQRALVSARAELARASRVAAVGALSASIAHELNQPLAALVMNAQTCLRYLRRPEPDAKAAAAAIARASQEAQRASAVVQRARDMVAKRGGREERFDVRALLHEVALLLDADIRAAGVELKLAAPAEGLMLTADRVAFQQMLVNLASNAVQAMSADDAGDRRLTISLDQEGSDMLLHVRDTGPGIREADLARLFEPFFTTKEGGVGVGLAISRSAVEARGGALKAFNAPDRGAVFECRVPLNREPV